MVATDDIHGPTPSDLPPLLEVVIYLGANVAWWIAAQVAVAIAIVARLLLEGGDLASLANLDPTSLMGAGMLAGSTLLLLGGMVAIAAGFAWLNGRAISRAFALRIPPWSIAVIGLVGGLCVGVFPGWLAENITPYLQRFSIGSMDLITQAMEDEDPLARVAVIIAVCIGAPLLEEVLFRGYLWDLLERSLPRPVVWVGTSLLFAAYHIDPIHVVSVAFIGFFLGWLRWTSGSVWPSVIGHFANNSLATVVVIMGWHKTAGATPLSVALAGASLTIILGGIAWWCRPAAAQTDPRGEIRPPRPRRPVDREPRGPFAPPAP